MDEEDFKDILCQMTDKNKAARKKGLENGHKLLKKNIADLSEEQREEIMRIVLRSLSDKSERCREVSCDICTFIFTQLSKEDLQKMLPFLFQVFARRLSMEEEYEPSEEVRVKMMELLTCLFEIFTTELQGNRIFKLKYYERVFPQE